MVLIAHLAASLCIRSSNSMSGHPVRIASQMSSAVAEAYSVNSELTVAIRMNYMNSESSGHAR
jgi:hypothetical protein